MILSDRDACVKWEAFFVTRRVQIGELIHGDYTRDHSQYVLGKKRKKKK